MEKIKNTFRDLTTSLTKFEYPGQNHYYNLDSQKFDIYGKIFLLNYQTLPFLVTLMKLFITFKLTLQLYLG